MTTYVAYFPYYTEYMDAREEFLYGCYLVSEKAKKEAIAKTCFDKCIKFVFPVTDKIAKALADENDFTYWVIGDFDSIADARKAWSDSIEADCADRDIGW